MPATTEACRHSECNDYFPPEHLLSAGGPIAAFDGHHGNRAESVSFWQTNGHHKITRRSCYPGRAITGCSHWKPQLRDFTCLRSVAQDAASRLGCVPRSLRPSKFIRPFINLTNPPALARTLKERVLAVIEHRQPDKVPVDLGTTPRSGVSVIADGHPEKHFGLTQGHTRVHDVAQPENFIFDRCGVELLDIGRAVNNEDSAPHPTILADGNTAQCPAADSPLILFIIAWPRFHRKTCDNV